MPLEALELPGQDQIQHNLHGCQSSSNVCLQFLNQCCILTWLVLIILPSCVCLFMKQTDDGAGRSGLLCYSHT